MNNLFVSLSAVENIIALILKAFRLRSMWQT